MYIHEQKEVKKVEAVLVAVKCDKCGKRIEEPDRGHHKYVSYSGYPTPGYPDDWSVSFQLCQECSDTMLETYLDGNFMEY